MNFNWRPQQLSYDQYKFLQNPDKAFKNRGNTKIAQEMLGFEGQDIDGKIGKATRAAYNQQMPYYNDLYGSVDKAGALNLSDPQSFYNDIHEADNYGFTPEQAQNELESEQQAEEQLAKQQRIKEIEAEIAEIEQRIAERKRGMAANEDALNTQLAAIEARKINQKDPTAIWRWKAGMDAQKAQRAEDLARVEVEKQKTEKRNKELNQYKIESILKNAMPTNARTRDELTMMSKNLNDAEELAKQYGDTDMLKRIDNRRQALMDHVPVSEKANEIESDFIKEMSMVGKVGGRTKAQFVEYVTDILEKNPDVWRYNPALQQKLYQAIGTNTKNTPKPTLPQET